EGVRENLQEVNSSFFPASHSGPGGERALPNDPAVNSSAYRDEYHRQFFRSIDTAFSELNAVDPLPLALVGVDRYLSFYREVAGSANTVITTLTGNHDKTPAHELGALVWPLVKQSLAAQRERVFGEFEAAIGAQRAASTLGEVWRFAHEGRVALLVVEEDYHQAATIDPSGMILTPVADPTTPGVLDDAVDEVITAVLDRGGRVVFADPAALAQHQRIAAVLRY
ncbi:MAG TPA: hypothetical protein PKC19_21360, partial [Roseiflexaceae bacterium]|nr:hypothetical protein [Roseiflexaceae bacterium]